MRDAYEDAWEQGRIEGDRNLGAMTIECRWENGKMGHLTASEDVVDTNNIKTLLVTTNIPPAAMFTSTGSSCLPARQHSGNDINADGETGMIDMSLAGCCGVQSFHGGLRITSIPEIDVEDKEQAIRERKAELARFRAAKLRHYFTM